MKKIIFVLVAILLLAGCSGSNEPKQTANENESENTMGDTLEAELEIEEDATEDKSIKDTAVQADFVEVNGDRVEEGTALFIEGKVSIVLKEMPLGSFSVNTEEGDGFGIYNVVNNVVSDVNEGDKVTVYGIYSGKDDDTSIPTITPTIIEIN